MQALLNAITTLFQTNATLQATFPPYNNADGRPAIACNFWFAGSVPQNAKFPYCVGTIISDTEQAIYQTAGSATTWGSYGPANTSIRFSVFTSQSIALPAPLNNALALAEATIGVFNAVLPTMPGGTELSNIMKTQDPVPSEDGLDKSGNPVYRVDFVFAYATNTP